MKLSKWYTNAKLTNRTASKRNEMYFKSSELHILNLDKLNSQTIQKRRFVCFFSI